MLTLSEGSKSFGGHTLFKDVALQVNRGDRIGLVGPNGAGKTTLFSLILGEDSPDEGTIVMEKRMTVGFLPQESAPAGDETVLELATSATPGAVELRGRIRAFEEGRSEDVEDYRLSSSPAAIRGPLYHSASRPFTRSSGSKVSGSMRKRE